MSDLKIGTERASVREAAAIESVVGASGERGTAVEVVSDRVTFGGAARTAARRHLLLPGLWALHDAVGWISRGGLNSLCLALGVPPAEAYGVATFYDLFEHEAPGGVVVRQCDDLVCSLRTGSPAWTPEVHGDRVTRNSQCLGQCDHGAAAVVQAPGEPLQINVPASTVTPAIEPGPDGRLLRRSVAGATTLDSYRALGGFVALDRARAVGADAVIELVRSAGLRGRGGAAFPTGQKWRAVADQPAGRKHVVVNADESEPGTFKDRVLMERDPFAIIESLAIAAFAVGASDGWMYVRGEYPRAYDQLLAALRATNDAGLLGDLRVEIRRGAGAYICGEETALLESIEGFRGEPRNKPPYPTTHGLFGEPTVINNVETLVNVIEIVADGPAAWAEAGTAESPGTRLFCLSGHVARPGVYEHALGVTLRHVIDCAGGVRGGAALQAVVLGGAAGVIVGPDRLDVELSFEGVRAADLTLGSGVVMVLDDTVDLRALVGRAAAFFAHESCGQCVPCRVGTQRQVEQLQRDRPDFEVLDDLDRVMSDASICGLGHTAASLVRSARREGLL